MSIIITLFSVALFCIYDKMQWNFLLFLKRCVFTGEYFSSPTVLYPKGQDLLIGGGDEVLDVVVHCRE